MKYLLVEDMGYDGKNFYSFESDKGKEELKKEFVEFLSKKNFGKYFYRHDICYFGVEEYEIISIEEFWGRHLPS